MTGVLTLENRRGEEIEALLPHRGEMLLVTGVVSVIGGERATTTHHVSLDEPCYAGGRRGAWPRTLLTEFIGQSAALLCAATPGDHIPPGGVPLFAGARDVTFTGSAWPGDTVVATATIKQIFGNAVFLTGVASVNGQQICTIGEALVVYSRPE